MSHIRLRNTRDGKLLCDVQPEVTGICGYFMNSSKIQNAVRLCDDDNDNLFFSVGQLVMEWG